jgi:predicted nucleic acid-binding protein
MSPRSSEPSGQPTAPVTDLAEAAALLVDASVLVECVVAGRHVQGADRLLDYLAVYPSVELVTAAHGLIETTSALRRLNLAGTLTDEDALAAAHWLRGLELRLDPTAPRIDRVWQLRHSMTAYDAAYAAAAVGFGVPLISTDAPLISACGAAGIPAVHLDDARW